MHLLFCFWKWGKGLYVALAILELSMFIMLVSNSQ